MSQLITTNGHKPNPTLDTNAIAKTEMAKRDFKSVAKIPSVSMVNQILKEYGVEGKEQKSTIISPENQIIVLRIWQLIQQGQTITAACQEVQSVLSQFNTEQKTDAIEKRVSNPAESQAISQTGQAQAENLNSAFLAQLKAEALEGATRLEQLKFILLGAARNSKAVQEDARVVQAKELAFNSSPSNALLDDAVFNQMIADGVSFFA